MTIDDITTEAIDRVERNADEQWKDEAYKCVRLARVYYAEFTTDTIWKMLENIGHTTHEPRAMGAIMRRAAKEGLIEPTGKYLKSRRPECHKRPVMLWRSTRD